MGQAPGGPSAARGTTNSCGSRPGARKIAAAAGTRIYELPVVKTAYILFGVAVLAIVWVKIRGEHWADFGLKPIVERWRFAFATLGLLLVLPGCSIVPGPFVDAWATHIFGGDPSTDVKTFTAVIGDLRLFIFVLPFTRVFAALGEEFFYRGFVMRRVAQTLVESRQAQRLNGGHGW